MRKAIKVLLITTALVGVCIFRGTVVTAKGEELPQEQKEQSAEEAMEQPETSIDLEGMVFASDEEAFAYLEEVYDIPVPYSNELSSTCNFTINGDTIITRFTTDSKLGTASSIGVKNVYIQYGKPGDDMVGNHTITGTYSTTDDISYSGNFTYNNLEKGNQYRAKLTHFIVVNGVEYTYTVYSKFINYYC